MAEFNDTYRKAGLLMTSALKKYEQGDFEGGDRDREEANKLYDLGEQEVDSAQNIAMLYGENRNFGIAYKVFESNTSTLFNDKKRKPEIKKILNLIKEDKTLKKEFDIYKTFVYPEGVNNPSEYVNEALSLIPEFDKKQIIESNEKFINMMRELKLNEMVELSDEDAELFEAVEYVMLNKKTLNNINDYVDAKSCITEHIEKNCKYESVNTDNKTADEVYENGVNEVAKKYNDTLNENERYMIESLMEVKNKEMYFNIAKNDTIKLLKEQVAECTDDNKDSIQKIIENITGRKYNENDFIADVAEFREIKNTLVTESDDSTLEKIIIALANQYKNYDDSGTAVGDMSRTEEELSYNLPDQYSQEEVLNDIKKLSHHYSPEDVAYMIKSNMMAGEYNGWWAKTSDTPKVF